VVSVDTKGGGVGRAGVVVVVVITTAIPQEAAADKEIDDEV
jgi:hypothetical protein